MQDFVLMIMNQYGYPGIGFLILIEHIFPPIPSEVILIFGGFLTTCTDLTLAGVLTVSTMASLLGACFLYVFGRFLNPEKLIWRNLHFRQTEVENANSWFSEKGEKAVFYGRCIPIVRSLVSIPAGMAKMKPVRFLLYTTAGSLIWNTVLIVLGAIAGESWDIILQHMSAYSALVKIGAAACTVTWILRRIR